MRKNLDHSVIPNNYDLDLVVHEDTFTGSIVMDLTAEKEVGTFKFNSKNLTLSNLVVDGIPAEFTEKDEFVTVNLNRKVQGDFKLSVQFKGYYSETMEGFYKSKYNDKNLYSTHFEPSDARQAFPCFDQPDMKSTFSIKITVPEKTIALSNNELEKKVGNTFIFKKTVKMSTYIVAWVVGDLNYIEDQTYKKIRVYAADDETKWGKFALDVAVRCLKYFEKYFMIEYPLPKLDLVAIPSFAMGAMENWGLITFRKTSLLFDENVTPIRSKINIANTVCHELAHMWFGNLVTMEWWDDLWLNEGFATWAATLAIANSMKNILDYDAWTTFINDDIEGGMSSDSLKSTHKIEIEVNDPVEVGQIFDAISYNKGSSIIKMIENWLGPKNFQQGLVKYIDKYKGSNAVTKNLWDSLNTVTAKAFANYSVSEGMDPWTKRPGFPYVRVVDLGTHLELTQERFTLGYEIEDEPWPIPIIINWQTHNTRFVMYEKQLKIKKENDFYKLNDDVSGFYRVLYPKTHLNYLLEKNYDYLSKSNILNLFSDQFAMISSLKADLASILTHIKTLQTENNNEIISSVIGNISKLRSIFYFDKNMVSGFNKIIEDLISQRALKIDVKIQETDINAISLNTALISSAVKIGLNNVIDNLIKNKDSINQEYRRSYYIAVVDTQFDEIFKIYENSIKPGEKPSALIALGSTKKEEYIDFLFNNIEKIEPHDSIYLFSSLGANLVHRNKIARLFIDNFKRIKAHIKTTSLIRGAIEYILYHVIQDGEIDYVYEFLESIKAYKEYKSALEKVRDSLTIALGIKEHLKNDIIQNNFN